MALEEALVALTVATNKNCDLLERLLSKSNEAAKASAAKPETAAEKKAREKADADAAKGAAAPSPPGDDANLVDSIKPALSKWLGEFAKEADKENPDGAHREVKARRAALKEAFAKLGVEKLGELTEQAQVDKLSKWLDKQIKIGRLDPDKVAAEVDDDL